jgi:hypothetical protein
MNLNSLLKYAGAAYNSGTKSFIYSVTFAIKEGLRLGEGLSGALELEDPE